MNIRKKRLAILSSHPIQYNEPIFNYLRKYFELEVFYFGRNRKNYFDKEFGRFVEPSKVRGYKRTYLKGISFSQDYYKSFNRFVFPFFIFYRLDYILIYGWNNWSQVFALLFTPRRTKVLFRGDSKLKKNSENQIKKLILRVLFERVDAFLSVGVLNDTYFQYYHRSHPLIIRFPHVVENIKLEFQPSEYPTLGFVGKFTENKQLPVFLDVFAELSIFLPKTRALVAGSGNIFLENYLNQKKNVEYRGILSFHECRSIYSSIDYLIVPSIDETWGFVVNEALIMGTKCVAWPGVVAASELLRDKSQGLVVSSVEQAVEYILDDWGNGASDCREDVARKYKAAFDINSVIDSVAVKILEL